ncbi:PREDICTED: uncharacterized protein LOC107100857 [Cyprinodon variegatus]|uniref:Uncharacterized LOC107100857 n=1 Tax=Cyprinodon variegatus TaxID=28743 RepID=A0A3Q2CGJ7_CYPVA|nr:PREDICTED: uncharacterized protein LOC107100857 [Cyprinodon variegatus]
MASKRSASILMTSMILLHWATAWSNPSTSFLSKELPSGSIEKTEKALNVAKETLSLLKDVMENTDLKKLSTAMKGISMFASLAPGVGALVFSTISMALAFIPEEDPLLNEVKRGFAEVNQKLDSLAMKISKLATDVAWYNYASAYSRDELTILNTWEKFSEFMRRTESQSPEETSKNIKIFTSYYESTGTEASVSNLYRYLTVESTSLTENLNNLLRKKFKCNVYEISRYSMYFSSLFWKGMVLNQFYWKLTEVKAATKEADQIKMFKKVSETQLSALEFCLENYEEYLKKDVEEIAKDYISHKDSVAVKVKEALDNKYGWYNWVVVVFDTSESKNLKLYTEFKFTISNLVLGVDYTVMADMINAAELQSTARECFENKDCEFQKTAQRCSHRWYPDNQDEVDIPFKKYAKITHVAYKKQFVEVPSPFQRVKCYWTGYESWLSVHYSRQISVCATNQCKNNGKCKRVLWSNEWLCECQDSYYGDTCEKQMNMTLTFSTDLTSAVLSKEQIIMIAVILSVLVFLFVLVLLVVLKRKNWSLFRKQNCSGVKSENMVGNRVEKMVSSRAHRFEEFHEMSESINTREIMRK